MHGIVRSERTLYHRYSLFLCVSAALPQVRRVHVEVRLLVVWRALRGVQDEGLALNKRRAACPH